MIDGELRDPARADPETQPPHGLDLALPGSVPGARRFLWTIADLASEGSDDASAGAAARLCLHDALRRRFGPDFQGAYLDRDWLLGAIDREISSIDDALEAQVNAILHAPALQRLEARWRGLRTLTQAAEQAPQAKVRILPVSWNDIVRDLERATDFDQSELFRKIYSAEFGSPGGEPFGLLIGDYEIRHRPAPGHPTDDVGALKSLAMVAAAAFAPIILGVSPSLLQLDSFRDLGRPVSLRGIFTQGEYQRWTAIRDGDDMRFVGLVLPRVLMRAPYGLDPSRQDGFRFVERVESPDAESYLWGSAIFAFASVVLRAFAASGWFADLRGAPLDRIAGGIVNDLPVLSFATDRPGLAIKPSTECMISDAQEKELSDLGFIVLRKIPFTNYSVFQSNPSLQTPIKYDRASASANARLSSMLQYVLCVSRFAHYIKVLGRDRIGSTMTAEECQSFLQRWLIGYCEGSDSASQETKARCPLREATIRVQESPSRPGAYSCTIFLRPHFQLDDIATGFRLVTELAPPRAA